MGYGPDFRQSFTALERPDLCPARVVREDRGQLQVDDGAGPRRAEPLGRLRLDGQLAAPAVGDWVALAAMTNGPSIIHAVLPRRSAFIRGRAGRRDSGQCVAANVDTLIIAMGLDGDENVRRLERYLVLANRSGASPVVVLTKADRSDDPEAARLRAAAVAGDAPVHVICAPRDEGIDALRPHLGRGQTVALVGSSGAGKSTLVNHLLGEQRMATAAVRDSDDRGRHTTRHRQLFMLPGAAALIDTPGMRELQMWGDEDDLRGGFPEIEALAQGCRFGDCQHDREPSCAVRAALDSGELGAARFASFVKLRAELRLHAERQSASAEHLSRRRGRRGSKIIRQAKRLKSR